MIIIHGEILMKSKKEITVQQAQDLLWRAGELSWKMRPVQQVIKKGILEDSNKISVVLCGRRLGKTTLMCIMALEACLKKQGSVVKFIFPRQKDAKRNILPLMRMLLEDCPKDVKPTFMEADKCFRFSHNNSEIQFAGSDSGNAESIRGGFADLCIFDEVGFASDVKYIVRSILSPTVKTTGGRVILVSTPPRNSNHEFATEYIMPYQVENRIKIFTLYDNPNFSQSIIDEIISEYPKGIEDPDFKREYLCVLERSTDQSILPSFTTEIEPHIVTDKYVRPTFYDAYVGLDIGSVDLTAAIFGYYDYLNATLVIEDELIFSKDVNTKTVAEAIKKKEAELWVNPIDHSPIAPYMRVADNSNLIMLTDMQRDHGLTFLPTRKDNREAAINSLDVAISQMKLIINPKCTHTIYHMKFAEWNKTRTIFKQLKDSSTGLIKGGHADCLAACIYLHRNIIKSKNPYPLNYGTLHGSSVHTPAQAMMKEDNPMKSWMKSIFKKLKD
jgi:PBSX family phage terminase large subunit